MGGRWALYSLIFDVSAGGAFGIKDDREQIRRSFLDYLEQHIGETEHGVRGQPGGSGQTPDSIKSPINIGITVYDIELIIFKIPIHRRKSIA